METYQIVNNDCLVALKEMADNSVDAIVTDPPYGISFMNKHWDYDVPKVEIWREALRVLKPGGHLFCACGTRTQHRMVVNIEDAGFEIRDVVAWLYGSGFPKSLNVGKAIDNLQGNKRESLGVIYKHHIGGNGNEGWNRPSHFEADGVTPKRTMEISKGTSEFEGWGTALKPAMELWTLARKPLSEKTVAENVLKWGTGGINIDGCRVEVDPIVDASQLRTMDRNISFFDKPQKENDRAQVLSLNGRFPANVIHDGSDEVISQFPNTQSGALKSDCYKEDRDNDSMFAGAGKFEHIGYKADEGSASRFFYCAKASKSERNKGVEDFEEKFDSSRPWCSEESDRNRIATRLVSKQGKNNHPTVKPVSLMRYLCRMITPPKGIILDPFMGSGSTGIGAKLEGFSFIGIEKEKEYCDIAKARIDAWEIEKPSKAIIEPTLF